MLNDITNGKYSTGEDIVERSKPKLLCNKCGKIHGLEDNFCRQCGNNVGEEYKIAMACYDKNQVELHEVRGKQADARRVFKADLIKYFRVTNHIVPMSEKVGNFIYDNAWTDGSGEFQTVFECFEEYVELLSNYENAKE